MNYLLALVASTSVAVVGVWLIIDAKERSRKAPDKDGFRAPEFLLFGESASGMWLMSGLLAFVGVIALVALTQ